MFGPDKCGTENKYHFIIRFKNPKTGVYEEKHAKKSELPEGLFGDGKTHLFTLGKFKLNFSFGEFNLRYIIFKI